MTNRRTTAQILSTVEYVLDLERQCDLAASMGEHERAEELIEAINDWWAEVELDAVNKGAAAIHVLGKLKGRREGQKAWRAETLERIDAEGRRLDKAIERVEQHVLKGCVIAHRAAVGDDKAALVTPLGRVTTYPKPRPALLGPKNPLQWPPRFRRSKPVAMVKEAGDYYRKHPEEMPEGFQWDHGDVVKVT